MTQRPRKTETAPPGRLTLPAVIDLPRASALKAELDAARGAPLTVEAEAVDRIGGLGQQVLMAAALSWQADGLSFAIAGASEGFAASAAMLGLDFTPFLEGAPT
ncbi:STAS domain-containing protein [Acidimangrovimonas sediminis]|uniref:STAS domain-containing protein n=1 Tax=Acidimangrovimonas sediminis TaxID=2056283 RepID=UPI000C8022E1|nr:STAS domain-containing protein [Acidimangrovimonas sediminis]